MTTDAPMFSTEEILWYDNGRWGEAGYAIANPNGKTWTNNGIYFLMPRYVITRSGSGQAYYGIQLPANDAASCTNGIYFLGVSIGTNYVSAGFSGDPTTAFQLEWQYNDFSTPPYVCLEDLVDVELTNTNNGISCIAGAGTHFKVTTIR